MNASEANSAVIAYVLLGFILLCAGIASLSGKLTYIDGHFRLRYPAGRGYSVIEGRWIVYYGVIQLLWSAVILLSSIQVVQKLHPNLVDTMNTIAIQFVKPNYTNTMLAMTVFTAAIAILPILATPAGKRGRL